MDFTRADALNGAIRLIAIKHRALAAAALAHVGLHPGHEAVLLALEVHGSQTQAELARRAGCEPPSITVMVQKLQAAGLIDRHAAPGNARAIIVELTQTGQELIPRVKELWIQVADDAIAGIADQDIEQLTKTLGALAASLQRARP